MTLIRGVRSVLIAHPRIQGGRINAQEQEKRVVWSTLERIIAKKTKKLQVIHTQPITH